MGWFDKANKTQRIGALEMAIARLASEIKMVKEITEKIATGVERLQGTLSSNHVAHTACETRQEGRWEAHRDEHRRLEEDFAELMELVRANTDNVRILSATVQRLADRQRS